MAATAAPAPDAKLQQLRQRCEQRLAELKLDRSAYEQDWYEISELIVPLRGRYVVPLVAKRPRRSGKRIVDPTGTLAHQRMAAFLMAGITNPALSWFKLGIGDDALQDDPAVKLYLAECQKRIYRVLAEGNFYTSMHQTYEEIGAFGTGAMICLQDFQDVVRFYPLTTGEYWLALNERQECDTLYREYSLTVGQLVAEFGIDNVSDTVRNLHDNGRLSGRFVVAHAIEPNRDVQPGLDWQSKPFVSLYYERGNNTGRFLRREGFSYCPFIAPRWTALSGDAYGTGPAFQALPDVKSLQATRKNLLQAGEKLVNPPLMGDAKYRDSFLGKLPGDENFLVGLDGSPHAGMRPIYTVPPNVSVLQQDAKDYQETIRATFFNDLIMAISQMEGVQPRNQMEIAERRNEKMLQLGPVLERFYGEALAPVIRMVFDVMQRGRVVDPSGSGKSGSMLPPLPRQLIGKQVVPSFVSVLATAQKAVGTSSLEQFLRFVGGMAGVWSGVIDKVDSDKVVERYGDDLDIDPDIMRPQQVVEAMRQQAAEQAQMQQAMQATPALAQGAKNLAGADVGGGRNALQLVTGQ